MLRRIPERLPQTVRHEMTHFYQDYAKGAPSYWREGIADYVACALSSEEFPDCPQCTVTHPHFTEGYECAAALLRYISEKYEPRIVPKLHHALTCGSYSDDFFVEATGKPLDTLWQEFQETPRFTPDAAIGLKLREQLKESAGKNFGVMPPFFKEFLQTRPGGPLLVEACDYLYELKKSGKLPGPAELPVSVSLSQIEAELAPELPATRTVDMFYSQDKKIFYRYELRKESPTAEWTLLSVHRIDNRTGKVLKGIAPETLTQKRFGRMVTAWRSGF